MNSPTTKLPTSAPKAVPEPAQRDRGEDQQQDLEAQLERKTCWVRPEQDAAQAGERGADDPDDHDHPLDVDAATRREGRVVRRPPGWPCPSGSCSSASPAKARTIGGDDHRRACPWASG